MLVAPAPEADVCGIRETRHAQVPADGIKVGMSEWSLFMPDVRRLIVRGRL